MKDSVGIGVRDTLGGAVVTGSNVAGGTLPRASTVKDARGLLHFITQRRNRFALTPCKSAIRANDTPGSMNRRAKARFADLL